MESPVTMSLFFLISGFLLNYKQKGTEFTWQNISIFYKKRVFSNYLIYLIFSLAALLFYKIDQLSFGGF